MLRSTHYTESPTGRTIEPVTTDEVRRQCRLDHTEDDPELAEVIEVARRECETVMLGNRALITGTVVDYFDGWADEMELSWGPNATTTTVKYYDTDETLQTLATTVYEFAPKNGRSVLRLKFDQTWPTLRGHSGDDIEVTYTVGEGTNRSDVPRGIRRWICARAAWYMDNRDGEEYPWKPADGPGLDALLAPFATGRVYAQ